MYQGIDVVKLAIQHAEHPESMISKDRKCYSQFYMIAEKYISEHGLILIGDIGIKLLLHQELELRDYQYEMISKQSHKDANALAKLLHNADPNGLGKYIYALPKIKDKHYEIMVDNRPLFVIKSLNINRGVNTFNLVLPAERPGAYAKDATGMVNLKVYDSELQLINIYSKLTDPSYAGKYPELVKYECYLRKEFSAIIKQKIESSIKKKTGGVDKPCTVSTKQLITLLLEKFVPRTGHVLVGDYAIGLICDHSESTKSTDSESITKLRFVSGERLQIITSNDIWDERKFIDNLIGNLGCSGFGVENNPNNPMDKEMRRMTFYINRKHGGREPLIDIFNSGNYQLIPHNYQIGTIPAIMKFTLIDFWTVQMLFRMENTSAQYTAKLLKDLYSKFKRIGHIFKKKFERGDDFEYLFPTKSTGYIGYYVDELVATRRCMMKIKTGPTEPFYPCIPLS